MDQDFFAARAAPELVNKDERRSPSPFKFDVTSEAQIETWSMGAPFSIPIIWGEDPGFYTVPPQFDWVPDDRD